MVEFRSENIDLPNVARELDEIEELFDRCYKEREWPDALTDVVSAGDATAQGLYGRLAGSDYDILHTMWTCRLEWRYARHPGCGHPRKARVANWRRTPRMASRLGCPVCISELLRGRSDPTSTAAVG
jgi:hypothetical protein